jgi:lipoprotein-anchoring transpeptidase ErfK/SrfK
MEVRLDPGSDRAATRRARRSAAPAPGRRWRRWAFAGVAVLLLAAAVDLPLAYAGSGGLGRQAHNLDLTFTRYQQEGVPVAALSPLRQKLAQAQSQPWFSPAFWLDSRQATISGVRQSTAVVWSAAMAERRHQAQSYLTEYRSFVAENNAWLNSSAVGRSSPWPAQLARASTPAHLQTLALEWKLALGQAKKSANSSAVAAAASVTLAASSTELPDQATAAEKLAAGDGLSALQVPGDASALQQALAGGLKGTAQAKALAQQLEALRAEIGLQGQVTSLNQTVLGLVDQAVFEQVPSSSAFQAQDSAAKGALQAAQTVQELGSAQGTLSALQGKVQAGLAANQCGHSTSSGKSIYLSISLQEMIFYDHGCVVNATPVTTGRPQGPTPTGTFSIFLKRSPLEFISGYAPGSPDYYTPFLAQYAMEFLAGGYYIHNAPWEPADAFGPGSEDNLTDASHGCVHTPLATLAWAYSWTPLGTPVVISA